MRCQTGNRRSAGPRLHLSRKWGLIHRSAKPFDLLKGKTIYVCYCYWSYQLKPALAMYHALEGGVKWVFDGLFIESPTDKRKTANMIRIAGQIRLGLTNRCWHPWLLLAAGYQLRATSCWLLATVYYWLPATCYSRGIPAEESHSRFACMRE